MTEGTWFTSWVTFPWLLWYLDYLCDFKHAIEEKKTKLIELLYKFPGIFFLWNCLHIPCKSEETSIVSLFINKSSWHWTWGLWWPHDSPNIYRAHSQCSHHTRLVEKHSKAGSVPITIFYYDSNQFWYRPVLNNAGNHSILWKSVIHTLVLCDRFIASSIYCKFSLLRNRSLFF